MSKLNDKPKVSAGTLKTAGRLMKYVTGPYKVQFIIALICILMTSISSIAVSLSLRFLLDDYILPLVGQQDPNFSELYKAMAVLACIFILGVIASFVYNRILQSCIKLWLYWLVSLLWASSPPSFTAG